MTYVQMANLVTQKPLPAVHSPDAATLQSALEILESIVLNRLVS